MRRIVLVCLVGAVLAGGGYVLVTRMRRERLARRVDAFVTAAGKGDVATVRQMLDEDPLLANAVQRSETSTGRPLTAAARGLHRDVVELLVARGADVNATLDDGTAPLHALGDADALGNQQLSAARVAMIEFLLAHGANVSARDDNGMTPLHRSAGDARAAAVLLEHHADVKASDGSGNTPLHQAVVSRSDHSAAVRLLVEHGADVNARNHLGMTPLMIASRNLADLETLIALHATVDVNDNNGRTPLHEMAETPNNLRSDVDVLALFCAAGLRPDAPDRAGKTPLGIAQKELANETSASWQQGRKRIVEFLSPGGACERLAQSGGEATGDQRAFAVAEAMCAEGSARGCERAAYDYEAGVGVAADQVRAVDLYGKACGLGLQSACTSLAFDYDQGHGVPADPAKAATLYAPACDAGESRACFNLAILYGAGRGVAGDHAKALALYRRACAGGEPDACEEAARVSAR